MTNGAPDLFLLTCPGVQQFRSANRESEGDYTYINWSLILGTNRVPDDYPLAYDKRLSNHSGMGINVVLVHGFAFWDFRAHWLKRFAAEHPKYHLPLPE